MRKLLFFHASWCPPCRFYDREFIAPLEKQVSPEQIERIDAWKEPWKAEKYYVDRLPAVVLLDGDSIYVSRTGAINIKEVAEWMKGCDVI